MKAVVRRQLPIEGPPDRALEVELEVGHPVAGLHQRRSLADHRVGELDPVGRGAEADLLPELDRVGGGDAGPAAAIRRGDREDVHRLRDVLQGTRAQRLEIRLERAAHLVEDLAGDADAAGLRDAFEPAAMLMPSP